MRAPQLMTKSRYSLPSTSVMRAPCARSTKKGSAPTFRNARTGEFTPPGSSVRARPNRSALRFRAISPPHHLTQQIGLQITRQQTIDELTRPSVHRIRNVDHAVDFECLAFRTSHCTTIIAHDFHLRI